MSDQPFQREKDIRFGKLDKEIPGYEEITGWLSRVPMTWLAGILNVAVKQCIARKVFKNNESLLRFVEKSTDLNDFLRSDTSKST